MDEPFVARTFQALGEDVVSVKIMRNKFNGELSGYGFIQFQNEQIALAVLHRLNGKVIPNTNPVVKFKLNHAGVGGKNQAEREFSLWVGELSPDVDDYVLYKGFASRYRSVRQAKVIVDNNGLSKGYGFIRFAAEEEQKDAMVNMPGYKGIGLKALKISMAVPKLQRSMQPGPNGQYYTPQYYQNYYQNYGNYFDPNNTSSNQDEENEYELVEHNEPLNIERLNMEFIANNDEFWDAVEASRWAPIDQLIHITSNP